MLDARGKRQKRCASVGLMDCDLMIAAVQSPRDKPKEEKQGMKVSALAPRLPAQQVDYTEILTSSHWCKYK